MMPNVTNDYSIPSKSEWPADDLRQALEAFDEEAFRKQYNDWMAREQPVLSDVIGSLSFLDKIILGAVGKREKHECLLEIGCGNGRVGLSLMVQNIVPRVVMIDISDAMVDNAKEAARLYGVNPVVLRSSLESFETQQHFDVVLAQEVLEHLFNLRHGLVKVAKFLKPGGLLCGTTPNLHTCDAVVHLHYFARATLERLLTDYFDDVMVSEIDLTGDGEIHLLFFAEGRPA